MVSSCPLSVCLVAEGHSSGLLQALLPQYMEELNLVKGECIVVGDFEGIELPPGVIAVGAADVAHSRMRGKLRNIAHARAHGRIVVSGDGTSLLSPPGWAGRLVEWAKPIAEHVPYVFGFAIVGANSTRYCDWGRIDGKNHVSLLEYGEQSPDLVLGAGYLGMSRPAWEVSGGFNDRGIGPGEEIEFTHRTLKDLGMGTIFCDVLYGVRVCEPRAVGAASFCGAGAREAP